MAQIVHGAEFQTGMLAGAKTVSKIVVPNYGPNGFNSVVNQKYDLPMVVNTGRKILKGFGLPDPTENLGAVLLRDAALKVADECGDGSITTVLLTDAILAAGAREIAAGANPMLIRKGMEKGLAAALEALKAETIPCEGEQLKRFANSVAKHNAIGETVCKALEAVGVDGIITVEDSQGRETLLNLWDGVRYEYGLISEAMVMDKVNKVSTLEKPFVLLVNYKIKNMEEVQHILEQCMQYNAPLLMIVSDMDEPLKQQIAANVIAGRLQVAVAAGPGHGDTRRRNMLALAAKIGSILFEEGNGYNLKDCGLEYCARVDKAVITKDSTLIQGFHGEHPEMVAVLKKHTVQQLEATTDPDEREKLEVTLGILNGKIAEIIAGGITEHEMFERVYLCENCIRASKAAARNGVLPGGGTAFLRAVPAVEAAAKACIGEEQQGVLLVREALVAPLRTLADNAGADGSYILAEALSGKQKGKCYNAETHSFCDPVEAGIVDSVDSALKALTVAVNTASTILTAQAAVVSK